MSQYRSSQQPSQQTRTKKKDDDPDAFMRLSDKEIAGCISDIGVPFQVSDLQKPNPQLIQMVFEHLGELLLNATRDSVDPAMRAAAEDICSSDTEIVPFETRMLMGFFVSMRQMLVECGIPDFSFNDLVRPTHERLVKIFSYVINFVRFRESQTQTIDENFNKAEAVKARIELLYVDNQDMETRLEDMKRNRKAMEAAVKDKVKRNDELKARLLELKKDQERIAEQLEKAKADKSQAQGVLEEKTGQLVRFKQESQKLRPYVLESPSRLQEELADLYNNLAQERQQIDTLERRIRALQTSGDSFGIVHNEVQSCVKVLEEVSTELQKEEEEESKAARNRDQVADRSNNVREIEQNHAMLQRQLDKWNERIVGLNQRHKERDEANKARMEELRVVQKQLREERADKSRDIDRKRARIDQLEKKMADLKEQLEKEVYEIREQYQKLESHITLYITEMEQSIS